jgi:hypothetical protein
MLTRYSRTVVLGAALVSLAGAQAALGGPPALAPQAPPDVSHHRLTPVAATGTALPVRPDDRAGARGPGALAVVAASDTATGFDWSDGAVGAAGGFAIGLAAAGVAVVATRRQRPVAADGAI